MEFTQQLQRLHMGINTLYSLGLAKMNGILVFSMQGWGQWPPLTDVPQLYVHQGTPKNIEALRI